MGMLEVQAQIAKGNVCFCGHCGREHSGTEPRVCKVIQCNCFQFRTSNPYALHLSNIERFIEQFKKWEERFDYLCKEMPFLYGLTNTEIVFWYWRFVYPFWNPEEEFMTEEIKTAIHAGAKPEAITRGFRMHKAKHRTEQEKFSNLVMWQSFNEEGYRQAAIESKR